MSVKLKKTKSKSAAKSESSQVEELEKQKGLSLFDHIKHISKYQDPDYYNSLTDLDKKTFNHFMILRGLSMNPALLDDISVLYRYFDSVPSAQFYQLLISIIPADNPRAFHPWVKASKKSKYSDELVDLVTRYFEVSPSEALDYITTYNLTESGKKELYDICRGYGLNEKEIDNILSIDD
jgi:hypothetical protein